jgi:prevent-host-death family protein
MITVGSYEAKTHLPALLDKVAKGERITITRRGVPIATLEPAGARGKQDIKNVIEQIKDSRRGRTTGGMSIREMIEEGRRY